MIVCVRIPDFIAAVHRRENVALRDKPILVAASGQVYATCDATRQAGITSGLALGRARLLYGDAQVVAAAPNLYRAAAEQMLQALTTFTPRIEPATLLQKNRRRGDPFPFPTDDGHSAVYYLDMERLSETECLALARRIRQTIQALIGGQPELGIATGKLTARIAAVCAGGDLPLLVNGAQEAAFLAGLPVTVLPTGPEEIRRLRLLGLNTLGEVARLPPGSLSTQFGPEGSRLWQLATGHDSRRVIPYRPTYSLHAVRFLDSPVENRLMLEGLLQDIVGSFSEQLLTTGKAVCALRLRLSLDNKQIQERRLALRQGLSTRKRLTDALMGLVGPLRSGVVEIEVELADVRPATLRQLPLPLFAVAEGSRLDETLRTLAARGTIAQVYHVQVRRSRLPEQTQQWVAVSPS